MKFDEARDKIQWAKDNPNKARVGEKLAVDIFDSWAADRGAMEKKIEEANAKLILAYKNAMCSYYRALKEEGK